MTNIACLAQLTKGVFHAQASLQCRYLELKRDVQGHTVIQGEHLAHLVQKSVPQSVRHALSCKEVPPVTMTVNSDNNALMAL